MLLIPKYPFSKKMKTACHMNKLLYQYKVNIPKCILIKNKFAEGEGDKQLNVFCVAIFIVYKKGSFFFFFYLFRAVPVA